MGERQPAKHHSSLATQASAFGTEGVLERSCSRAVAVGTRRHRPLALAIGKRRQHSSLLFYRFRVPLSSRFFFAVRAAYRFRCVTVRTKHT